MRELAICDYCDTVHRRPAGPATATVRCVNCEAPLYHRDADVGAMLAVTLTAVVGFGLANWFPLVSMSSGGVQSQATLWQAIDATYEGDLPFTALVLLITLVVAPLVEILLLLWVLVPLRYSARPPAFALAMRALRIMRPWRLVEVFLLGVVVALVKLTALANASPGIGVYGVVVLTVALATLATFDRGALWRREEEIAG